MNIRGLKLVVVPLLLVMFGATACGSDKKAGAPSGTTSSTVVVTTTTDTPSTDGTDGTDGTDATDATDAPTPLTDEDFKNTIDDIIATVDGATDLCDLSMAFEDLSSIEDPANVTQVKDALRGVRAVFTAMADTAPAGQEASAAALREFVTSFETAAKNANYDPKTLGKVDTPEAVSTALEAFGKATSEC